MLCRNPFIKDGAAFGCGQCEPCRFSRRRTWAHRIMLEALCHKDKAFIGLSYSELWAPVLDASFGRKPLSLKPKHLQDWLKRVRAAVQPSDEFVERMLRDGVVKDRKELYVRLRYFGVGEYGDKSWRPHFHVILYGYPTCFKGRTHRDYGSDRPMAYKCCPNCELIQSTWPFGDVDLGTVTHASAGYCASYTVKKMTSPDDGRLYGRHPEFARMSLKPGIGVDGLWDIASSMMEYGLDESMADVPSAIAYGKQQMPLGRYLRGNLRRMIGRDAKAPQATLEAVTEELRPLREAAFDESRSFKDAVVGAGSGRYAQIMAKSLIFKDRRGM